MIQVIPAIDIIDGKCVRLRQGSFNNATVYDANPVEVARRFQDAGFRRLHLVDLDGARLGAVSNWKVLQQIAAATRLEIEFGGGIKHPQDVATAFSSGAAYVSIGSMAVTNPALLQECLAMHAPQRFILGADVLNGRLMYKGWTAGADISLEDFISQYVRLGVQQFCCTDISCDGMLQGPSLPLYQQLRQQFPHLRLIASGGVGKLADIIALDQLGCTAVIVGKAIYEGKIKTEELVQYAH